VIMSYLGTDDRAIERSNRPGELQEPAGRLTTSIRPAP
jgi:hypothetical protein